jgi:ribosome biogenesis protein MAK21
VQDVSNFLTDFKEGSDRAVKKKKESLKPAQGNDAERKRDKKKINKHVRDPAVAPKEEYAPIPKTLLNQSKTKFLVTPAPHWYTSVSPLPSTSGTISSPTATQLSSLTDKASTLHSSDVQTYNSSLATTSSASDAQFLQKVLHSGTLSDRLSAMTLMVQGSPIHNIKALEALKNMAERGKGKGGREESLKALRCIVDWWIGGGAPDRKLRLFHSGRHVQASTLI